MSIDRYFSSGLSLLTLGAIVSVIVPISAIAQDTLQYDWLTMGEKSGSQVVTVEGDERRIEFEFNDRGRGPNVTTVVRLNEAGVPVSLRSTGHNYQKGEVDETFVVEDGVARWQSTSEDMTMTTDGSLFYLPDSWPPEYTAILARAILDQEDGELDLLPSGTARIEAIQTESLSANDDDGAFTLYAITGLGPMPNYVWLDQNQELFGVDYGWFAITPDGHNEQMPVMKAAQEAHTDRYIEDLSQQFAEPLDGLLAITSARVFDPADGSVMDNATVFVMDGMITAVYSGEVEVAEDTRVIDAAGQFLMPALWDMHGHISPDNYFGYIAAGVTHVRDMANDPEYLIRARRQIADGRISAPDIHAMGFIDRKNEFAAPTGLLAESLEEALEHVDYYARHGFGGIKLYSSIEPHWVPPIIERAHGLGLKVLGHIPSGMSAEDAIHAGFDEVTHINMVFLNFLGARQIDTRTPKRFTEVGERGGDLDLESETFDDFVGLMLEHEVALDPTVGVFMNMFLNQPGEVTPVFRSVADHLPALIRRGIVSGESYNQGNEAAYQRSGEATGVMVRQLHDRGVRLLPGTDSTMPGLALISELVMYAEAGIPNADVLRLGTLESARHLGLDQQYGRIAPGMRAHLILVEGDPLADMNDLYRVRTVIKDHSLYRSDEILSQRGFRPF